MPRALLLVLPAIAVAVVAFALLVVAAERPSFGARVYGGPTEGASVLAFRVAIVERLGELEVPAGLGGVTLDLTLSDGRRLGFRGPLDGNGMASARFDLARSPALGSIRAVLSDQGGRLSLGQGSVRLTREEWLTGARREGGWLNGRRSGSLVIRAAVERGVLAVPFREPLLIEVRGPNGPVEGAELKLALVHEGLEIPDPPWPSDARGNLRVEVAPREHVAALRISAKAGSLSGEWYSLLPVVPGALKASLEGGRLRIESPIVRELSYYAIISERERLAGGPVKLDPDGRGGAVALVDLPLLPAEPLWAVVSSEPELDSPSSIGWPINAPPGEPAHTFTLTDRLLLDTVPHAVGRERARRNRARWLAGGFTLACLGLIGTLLFARTREAQEKLEAHLARTARGLEGAERVAERRPGLWLVVALLCIALGFMVILLVLLYRQG